MAGKNVEGQLELFSLFDSVEELKAQIQRDANAGKQYFQKRGLHS